MTVVLLGPQRFRPSVRNAVRAVQPEGPVATITAGWQEREPDDVELDGLLDGRTVNLGLYGRWLDVHERDPELATAIRERSEVLDELQSVYTLWLSHAIAAVSELVLRDIQARVAAAALDDAVAAVRNMDRRHVELVDEVHAEFYDRWQPHERQPLAEHRAQVTELLEPCGAVAIAGGHVGALLECLHLFNVAPALAGKAAVGWSAGAMALTERVVLFNDSAPDGRSYSEILGAGLGLCSGVVALPHARRRLALDDPVRVLVLARRFAPAKCVILDDGARVDCGDALAPDTPVLTQDGMVGTAAEVAA
jgi:hypothetical protein